MTDYFIVNNTSQYRKNIAKSTFSYKLGKLHSEDICQRLRNAVFVERLTHKVVCSFHKSILPVMLRIKCSDDDYFSTGVVFCQIRNEFNTMPVFKVIVEENYIRNIFAK